MLFVQQDNEAHKPAVGFTTEHIHTQGFSTKLPSDKAHHQSHCVMPKHHLDKGISPKLL